LPVGSTSIRRLPSLRHAAGVQRAGAQAEVAEVAVVVREQHRVDDAMALLEHRLLLLVQHLDRGQHPLRRAAAVRLAGRLRVARHREREAVVAPLAQQSFVSAKM
jgi:hypothetical protein